MRDRTTTTFDPGTVINCLTAELADAAYVELLRSRISGSWIELKLDVWQAVGTTVSQRLENLFAAGQDQSEPESEPWRDVLLAELTEAAYRAGLRYGLQSPFLEVELGVRRALATVIERLPARFRVAARFSRLRPGWNS
jgi:hypothetical protein